MSKFDNNFVFPSVVSTIEVSEDISNFFEYIKTLEFIRLYPDPNEKNKMYSTENFNLLESIPKLKTIILNYFNEYKNSVLKLSNTNFDISTSWSMKINNNSYSHVHKHDNSYYSGVLYLSDHPDDSYGELIFYNFNIIPKQFLVLPENENSFLNDTWTLKPKKNLLIFFPSYLMHRVSIHYDSNPRYSIAFNIIPTGEFGRGDSSLNIQKIV